MQNALAVQGEGQGRGENKNPTESQKGKHVPFQCSERKFKFSGK